MEIDQTLFLNKISQQDFSTQLKSTQDVAKREPKSLTPTVVGLLSLGYPFILFFMGRGRLENLIIIYCLSRLNPTPTPYACALKGLVIDSWVS